MCKNCNTPGAKPLAAIWWRVSTAEQLENSPPSQISDSQGVALAHGYETTPEYTFGTDWHSLSVWDSPPMKQIRNLIESKAIHALIMQHPDRAPDKPAHRLHLRALCDENNVEMLSKNGEFPRGEAGEVLEFLDAWAKEKQVKRAQQGARDGTRDRARLKGLPASMVKPYGYQFRYRYWLEGSKQSKTPEALEPDPDTHWIICEIFQMAMQRKPIRQICKEMVAKEIPPPKGGKEWHVGVVGTILRNPTYGGRYYALRYVAVEPKNRSKSDTYGKTSRKLQPREDWLYVDFPIEAPPITWEQWETLQGWLTQNKAFSPRSSKVNYLLRGLLYCGLCGRKIQGHSDNGVIPHYQCPRVRLDHGDPSIKCKLPHMSGRDLEPKVWKEVVAILENPKEFIEALKNHNPTQGPTRSDAESAIKNVESELQKLDKAEAGIIALKISDPDMADALYQQQVGITRAKRTHYTEELTRQQDALISLGNDDLMISRFHALYDGLKYKLRDANFEDQRFVLLALNTRITVFPDRLEIGFAGTTDQRRQIQERLAGKDFNTREGRLQFEATQVFSPPNQRIGDLGDYATLDDPEIESKNDVLLSAPLWRCRQTDNEWAISFAVAIAQQKRRKVTH